jgi:AraC-like DNA-binding protein/ligand-binding sensor protein
MSDVSIVPLTPSNTAPDPSSEAPPSLLERLISLVEAQGQLSINFEDLSGVSLDVPDLRLSFSHRLHSCRFCQVAKRSRDSHLDCIRNKMASNRVALRRQTGFSGMCHLGMTDIVEPLVYRGRVLGVFYMGSVVLAGTEQKARERVLRYCARRRLDASELLSELRRAPVVEDETLRSSRERIALIAEVATRILDSSALPLDRYRTEQSAHLLQAHKDVPGLVQAAIRYIHRQYASPVQVIEVAAYLKCHPDYLSRLFKKSIGCAFGEYLMRVRIDRARNLIALRRFSMGEIAWNVGFQDQSHFGRVFRRLVGTTPREFQEKAPAPSLAPEQRLAVSFLKR